MFDSQTQFLCTRLFFNDTSSNTKKYHTHSCNSIIIIEDHKSSLDKQIRDLESTGIPILGFSSAAEFLEFMNNNECKKCSKMLIITDYFMPNMNGMELATRISGMNISQDLRLVLLSADEVNESEELFYTTVSKPVDTDLLLDIYKDQYKDDPEVIKKIRSRVTKVLLSNPGNPTKIKHTSSQQDINNSSNQDGLQLNAKKDSQINSNTITETIENKVDQENIRQYNDINKLKTEVEPHKRRKSDLTLANPHEFIDTQINNKIQNEALTNGGKKHVCNALILVEDHTTQMKKYTDFLKSILMPQIEFQNGFECLKQFKESTVLSCNNCSKVLLLIDQYMPRMNGIELTNSIKEIDNVSNKKIKFILASADEVYECLKTVDEFVEKPLDPPILKELYDNFQQEEINNSSEDSISQKDKTNLSLCLSRLSEKKEQSKQNQELIDAYLNNVNLSKDFKSKKVKDINKIDVKLEKGVLEQHVCKEIILVEDNSTILKSQEQQLVSQGVRCVSCNNAAECLSQLEKSSVKSCTKCSKILIVTDYFMPGLNGVELAQKVKTLGLNKSLEMHLATADDQVDEDLFKSYLKKPIDLNTLQSIWQNFMLD